MTDAIVLIGPTGSGKTPLGQMLEAEGLGSRKCLHLDFGHLLRRAAAGDGPNTLTDRDMAFIRKVLHAGALLENEHFPIAGKLLAGAIGPGRLGENDLVVLNGLPRHVGQARDLDILFDVTVVVDLVCSGETVRRRIGTNVGGDRAARMDDDERAVGSRLALFARRTRPLVEHYRRAGARIMTLHVDATTTAEDLWQTLNHNL